MRKFFFITTRDEQHRQSGEIGDLLHRPDACPGMDIGYKPTGSLHSDGLSNKLTARQKMKHIRLAPPLLLALLCLIPGAAEAKEIQTATVKELVKAGQSWDGTPLPAYPAGAPEITILRITIPPGVRLPLHRHPLINAGVLVRGQLTVVTRNGKTLQMKAGDPIIEVVDTWHYGQNEGTDPAEIIVFYAGTPGQELSIKEDH